MNGYLDQRAVLALTIVAPSLVVGLARYIPVGPEHASAATEDNRADHPPMLPRADVGTVELDGKQRAIVGAAVSIDEVAPSPFRVEQTDDAEIIELLDAPPEAETVSTLPAAPDFHLSAVISGRRTVAIINGKACIVGSSLGDGWVVGTINPDTQQIVIHHQILGKMTLSMRPD